MLEEPEAWAASNRRLAQLIAASAPGGWDWDLRTNRFLASRRLREIVGFSPHQPVELQDLLDATHPDDRGWGNLTGNFDASASDRPQLVRFRIVHIGTGQQRWIASRIVANRADTLPNEILGYSGTVEDITAQTETAQALVESEERLRLAIEAGKMAVWEVDLQTGSMTPSPELNLLCGFEPGTVPHLQDVRALYNPGEIERLDKEGATVEVILEKAVGGAFEPWQRGTPKSGTDRTQVQAEVAITTPAGVPKRLLLRAQYAPSPEGRPRLTGVLVDITETKIAQERLAVVARELQHRVKNSLTVIQSIAVQSLRGKTDTEAALHAFLGRIGALGAATDLILEHRSSTADLHGVIDKITRPYRDQASDPFVIDGPSAPLPPNAATAIGMVLHELCTNAVKYGSLSVAGGRVLIHSERLEDGRLVVNWEERNGPPVLPPSHRGFGTRLLENIVSGDVGGKVLIEFNSDGLHCRIEIALTHAVGILTTDSPRL